MIKKNIVPEWATDCTVRAMPSLTIQYNSDSATVELSRDCGEEGTRHMTCRGKQDRDFIMNELTCIDEADTMNMDNTIKPSTDSLTESHKKSQELIETIPSDNNEDNTIDLHANQIESFPEKDTEKFNVEEIMFGDQPYTPEYLTTEKDAELIKPNKLTKKQLAKDKYLKKSSKMTKEVSATPDDELMMGDQPALTLEDIVKEDTNESDEKKPKDIFVKPATKEPIAVENTSEAAVTSDVTTVVQKVDTTTVLPSTTSTTVGTVVSTEAKSSTASTVKEAEVVSSTSTSGAPETEPASIPTTSANIKITKKSFNSIKRTSIDGDELLLLHDKDKIHEESAALNDHFIPPMLLVRTMFTASNPHAEHNSTDKEALNEIDSSLSPTTVSSVVTVSTTIEGGVDTSSSTAHTEISTTTVELSTAKTSTDVVTETTQSQQIRELSISSTVQIDTTTAWTSTPATVTEEAITTTHTIQLNPDTPHLRPPHAPKYSAEPHTPAVQQTSSTDVASTSVSEATTIKATEASTTVSVANETQTTPAAAEEKSQKLILAPESSSTAGPIATSNSEQPIPTESASSLITTESTVAAVSTTTKWPAPVAARLVSTTLARTTTVDTTHAPTPKPKPIEYHPPTLADDPYTTTLSVITTTDDHAKDFNNSENFQPYKPNRRRDLTKPESKSYIKKIFG